MVSKKELEELARVNKDIGEFKLKQIDRRLNTSAAAAKSLKEIAFSLIGNDDATEHKNKLLEYERKKDRTAVIDDEMDYFDLTSENWISNEKREELKEKVNQLHEDRFDVERRFELDFATRGVKLVEVHKVTDLKEEVNKLKEETEFKSDYEIVDFKQILDSEPVMQPFYVDNIESKDKKDADSKQKSKLSKNHHQKQTKTNSILPNINLIRNRLQNSDLFDFNDEGNALSISMLFLFLQKRKDNC